jgi:hypothetical protein
VELDKDALGTQTGRPDQYLVCYECELRTGLVNWFNPFVRAWQYICRRCW